MSDASLLVARAVAARRSGGLLSLFGLFLLAAALSLGMSGSASAQSRQFACSQAGTLTIAVEDPQTISATLGTGKARRLQQDQGTPLDFTAPRVKLHIALNQESVRIEQPGVEDIVCIYQVTAGSDGVAVSDEPVTGKLAKSWGGVVRAGPGMDFAKVTSLKEGDPIILVERTTSMMNGFPWFAITFGDQSGFQWGGIICAVGKPVAGTFEQCN